MTLPLWPLAASALLTVNKMASQNASSSARSLHAPCIAGRLMAKTTGRHRLSLRIHGTTQSEMKRASFQEATERGAVDVARYHYRETVCIHWDDGEIRSCVWKGLDDAAAAVTADTTATTAIVDTTTIITTTVAVIVIVTKRRSSEANETDARPAKRSRSSHPKSAASTNVHRQIGCIEESFKTMEGQFTRQAPRQPS